MVVWLGGRKGLCFAAALMSWVTTMGRGSEPPRLCEGNEKGREQGCLKLVMSGSCFLEETPSVC